MKINQLLLCISLIHASFFPVFTRSPKNNYTIENQEVPALETAPTIENHFETTEISEQEEYLKELIETLRKPKAKGVFEGLQVQHVSSHRQAYKDGWTILVYIAGDNDLYKFAIRNMAQLGTIGSDDKLLNIVIHFDYHQNLQPKESRRFFVERGRLVQVGSIPAMDSGSEKTLISAAEWAIKNYPSRYFAVVLWNHGSGDLNPSKARQLINPAELFYYDPITHQITLDRSITFLEFLSQKAFERGICFDDSTGNYLNDTRLAIALQEIVRLRNNRKIDIVLMDACLMAGIGTAQLLSHYADYMTGSQEVVLGPGYNYASLVRPLASKALSPEAFAQHTVSSYAATYGPVTQDYTESAINLNNMNLIAQNVNSLARLILYYSVYDPNRIILRTVKLCGSKELCTHFEEPTYIDLRHFYENLLVHCAHISIQNEEGQDFYSSLKEIIATGIDIHSKVVIHNVAGKNFARATGLSLYFPQRYVHPSFELTYFGRNSDWLSLIKKITQTT